MTRRKGGQMPNRIIAEVAYIEGMERALHLIAQMPTGPRPDGTFNYSREAIIDIAKDALAANPFLSEDA